MNFSTSVHRNCLKRATHVIFDLDGLLLNTEVVYKAAIESIAKEHGKKYTNELRMKVIGTPEKVGCKMIVTELQLPITPEEFNVEFRARSKALLKKNHFMPGAQRLVHHFYKNRVPIAVATSSCADGVKLKIAPHLGTFSFFHHIVAGASDSEVKRGKPSPDIYLVCASRFSGKPEPEHCLVLEDAPSGVLAATKAGMQCVMVPDINTPSKFTKQATMVLGSLEEFKPEYFALPPLNKRKCN